MAKKIIKVEDTEEEKKSKKEKKKIDLSKITKTLKENEGTIEMLAGSLGDILDSSSKNKKTTKLKGRKKSTKKEGNSSSLSKILKLFLNR
ncbi:MAG: hypothetical protein IJK66_04850 [Bacilli bacterium]|nr:hypothetical protein [Bacilli bacterium]